MASNKPARKSEPEPHRSGALILNFQPPEVQGTHPPRVPRLWYFAPAAAAKTAPFPSGLRFLSPPQGVCLFWIL